MYLWINRGGPIRKENELKKISANATVTIFELATPDDGQSSLAYGIAIIKYLLPRFTTYTFVVYWPVIYVSA